MDALDLRARATARRPGCSDIYFELPIDAKSDGPYDVRLSAEPQVVEFARLSDTEWKATCLDVGDGDGV